MLSVLAPGPAVTNGTDWPPSQATNPAFHDFLQIADIVLTNFAPASGMFRSNWGDRSDLIR